MGDIVNNRIYTEEDIVTGDFLFASYKHENKELVTEVIDYLLGEGVRIWFDADLCPGKVWSKIAEKLISHENCKGVVFFNSVDSFKSDPVEKERLFAIEKQALCEKNDKPFFIVPVNIGKPSTIQLLKSVFDSFSDADSESQLEKDFPLSHVNTISGLFNNSLLRCYMDPADKVGSMHTICDAIKTNIPTAVDTDSLRMRALEQGSAEANVTISIGICRDKSTDILPAYHLQKDQRVRHQNVLYIVRDGQAYTSKPITWRPLYCENDVFVLIAETTVDIRRGGNDLLEWLNGEFSATAFSDEERSAVSGIRLLSAADMAKISGDDTLIFPAAADGSDAHWWIAEMGSGVLQKVMKKNGTIYNNGYNFRAKRSGVRPVISVHRNALAALTGSGLNN